MIDYELDADSKGPEAQYREYLSQGKFMIQKSESTGKYTFYPRIALPKTGETDLTWVPASGYGTLYAITVNRSKSGSYNIALVDLDEGPRMATRIEGVETASIGSRVKANIINENETNFVVFRLVEDK